MCDTNVRQVTISQKKHNLRLECGKYILKVIHHIRLKYGFPAKKSEFYRHRFYFWVTFFYTADTVNDILWYCATCYVKS